MKQERKVAIVIQARLSSQRVPNKMLRPFGRSSLFEIALEKLYKLNVPTEDIWVAVHEEELLDVAKKFPFRIFRRTKESANSTNDPKKPDSLKLLYEWYQTLMDEGYTHVVLVSACNPLLKRETIQKFYEGFTNREIDGAFSVIKKKNYYWDGSGKAITDWQGMKLMNTRKVETIYERAHCLYGSKISFIEDECWMGDTSPPEPTLIIIPEIEAVDIDTMSDFYLARVLYKNRFKLYDEEEGAI